jgi:CheY-like chemotaxis protein
LVQSGSSSKTGWRTIGVCTDTAERCGFDTEKESTMLTFQHPPNTQPVNRRLEILVADDHEFLRAAMRGLLRGLGHSVDVVTNGKEAIEAAAGHDYDVIFLDVQMPEMGGFEAALVLRQTQTCSDGDRTRIIGVSGEEDCEESIVAAGMDAFLLKPVRLGDLVRILNDTALCRELRAVENGQEVLARLRAVPWRAVRPGSHEAAVKA